jgi:hypothetical protein
MLDETAKGVFTIAVTPFLPDGALDLPSIDRMVDFYEEKGATGLTILGMMGEAGKLSAEESVEVVTRVTARASVPVVVGVSAPGLAAIGALSKTAMDKGAAGVMVAPQGGLKSDDQILGYFANVAETLGDIPWVLQDFPLVTGWKCRLRLPEDLRASPDLRDAETRGLAGARKDLHPPPCRGKRRPPRLDPLRQRRAVPARGDDPRRRWRDDRLRLPRDDGRRGPPDDRGRGNKGPRSLRRLHAAHPLRGAAGSRPRHPQAHARAPGRHRARHRAQTLAAAVRGRHRRVGHLIARQEARLSTLA